MEHEPDEPGDDQPPPPPMSPATARGVRQVPLQHQHKPETDLQRLRNQQAQEQQMD